MKVHSNFTGPKSKKRLIAFSCATALASFAFIARPAFAEEAKADNSSNLDVNATTTANVETTADLLETKVVEAPATTENLGTTQSTTNVSEQATTSAASSEVVSETASTTANESQTPTESVAGQTREAVTTDRAASETASVPNETNVTGGQYYSDDQGYWHYKDASGKDLTGPQTIDGVKVYFNPGGVQVKGGFGWDGHYYDKDSGALVTNKFVEEYGRTYYVDENGNKAIGSKEVNGAWYYFEQYGELIKNNFAPDGRYYDKYGKQVDFGTNRYFELNGEWYYAGNDGAILKGPQTIDGVKVYFRQYGAQVKGYFVKDEGDNKSRYYDKDTGALATNQYVIAYNPYKHRNERYYVNDQGIRLTGPQTIDGKQVYFDTYEGSQVFDNFADDGYFYDQDGNRVDLGANRYVQIRDNWYYVGNDGKILTGEHIIDGAHVYFEYGGKQVKGDFDYKNQFHDKDSGNLVTNRFVTVNDKTYFIGADSKAIKGATVIDNIEYFFDEKTGAQVKGNFASNKKYYNSTTGALVINSYVQVDKDWYYVGNDGKRLKGSQTINNVPVYFDTYDGKQAKGVFGNDGYFYDKDSGAKIDLGTNRYVYINDNWYYLNGEGKTSVSGMFPGTITNLYYFENEGQMYGEYYPEIWKNAYGTIVNVSQSGTIYRINDANVRTGIKVSGNDMLELVMAQDGKLICLWHDCSWSPKAGITKVLWSRPVEFSASEKISVETVSKLPEQTAAPAEKETTKAAVETVPVNPQQVSGSNQISPAETTAAPVKNPNQPADTPGTSVQTPKQETILGTEAPGKSIQTNPSETKSDEVKIVPLG